MRHACATVFDRHLKGKFVMVVTTHPDQQITIHSTTSTMLDMNGTAGIDYLKQLRCKNDQNPQNLFEKLL